MKSADLAKPDEKKVGTIPDVFSADDLAGILGISKRAVNKKKWACESETCRGGIRNLFTLQRLPVEVRKQILVHYGQIPESLADCVPEDMDQARIVRCSQAWDQARDWQRKRARARQQILQSWSAYESRSSRKSKRDKAVAFCLLYSRQDPSLGLDSSVFEAQTSVGRTQLYQWERDFKEIGIAGLISRHGRSRGRTTIPPDQQRFILGCVAEYPHFKGANISRLLNFEFPDSPLEARAINRFLLRQQERDPALFEHLRNPDRARSKFQPAFGNSSDKSKFPLHFVEVDSTTANVFCRAEDGKRRPNLVSLIDVFSRRAIVRVSHTSNSGVISGILRDCCLRFGVPKNFIRDNGKDYTADHIDRALTGLDINPITLEPFKPEDKPHIERFYRTISTELFELLPGFSGHNLGQRKDIDAQRSFAERISGRKKVEKLLSPDELQALIDDWLEYTYHQGKHGGIGTSPNAKFSESDRTPTRIYDSRALDILLAPGAERKVGKKGIRDNNQIYQSIELVGDRMGTWVEIRRDPWDAGRVYVFDRESREFVCEAVDSAVVGYSREDYAEIIKTYKRDLRQRARALQDLGKAIPEPAEALMRQAEERDGKIFNLPVGEQLDNPAVDGAIAAADSIREREEQEEEDLAKLQDPQTFLPIEPSPSEHSNVVQLPTRTQVTPETATRPLFRNQLERFIWSQQNHQSEGYTEADDEYLKVNRAHWESYADAFNHQWSDADREWLHKLLPDKFGPVKVKEDSNS